MKRFYFTLLSLSLVFNTFSQSPISIDKIINDLNWGNCNESDVILAFRDNIVKKEKEDEFDGNGVSSFVLSKVQIGTHLSDANIIVNRYNRKLLKIGGIQLRDGLDWSKGGEAVSKQMEHFFSSFWGKEYKKVIEYDSDYVNPNKIYTSINCEWKSWSSNEKSSKGSFYLSERGKFVVIAIEPK